MHVHALGLTPADCKHLGISLHSAHTIYLLLNASTPRCWRVWSRCASARACTSAVPASGGCITWCTRCWTTPSTRFEYRHMHMHACMHHRALQHVHMCGDREGPGSTTWCTRCLTMPLRYGTMHTCVSEMASRHMHTCVTHVLLRHHLYERLKVAVPIWITEHTVA